MSVATATFENPFDLSIRTLFAFAQKLVTGIKHVSKEFLATALNNPQTVKFIKGVVALPGMAVEMIRGAKSLAADFFNATGEGLPKKPSLLSLLARHLTNS